MKLFKVVVLGIAASALLPAQVTFERLLNAGKEPHNWLTYSGTYKSQRYSLLDQITRENASDLELKWVFQAGSLEKFEATPLVADGVMYVTEPPNNVVALDAATGRVFWKREHVLPRVNVCCGRVNRGLAILGDTLYLGTIDGKLIALDARNGGVRWEVQVADHSGGYALMHAPLIVKDKVLIGTAGGEYGIRGYLDAYDAETGERAWRFYTVPGPGEPGHETWEGDSWKRGGGSVWLTGSYDPELDLMYWGIGNPSPDWNGDVREGDNLYTDSVVALDPDDGEMKWYFQFTPHDVWDWDAVQIPVLADLEYEGEPRKLILWGNRNGFYYVLDRETGEFLHGRARGRHESLPWRAGRHELVLALLQSAHRPVLSFRVGKLRHLPQRNAHLHARQPLRGQPALPPLARCGEGRRPGLQRHPGARSAHGREAVGVQAHRRHRKRRAHYQGRRAFRRQPSGALFCPRPRKRRPAVEGEHRRPHCRLADDLRRGRQAVRVHRRRALAVYVRAARGTVNRRT